jgi:hypothetical protein
MSKRHARGTPEFHLDSSTLNRMLREDKVQAVISAAHERGALLYVASPVIDELVAGDDNDHLRRVAKGLLELFDSACFRISPGLETVLRDELLAPIPETPMVSKDFRRNYRTGLRVLLSEEGPASRLTELRQRQAEMKRPWGQEDEKIAEAIREQLKAQGMGAQEIGEELAQLSPARLPAWLLEFVVQRLLSRTDASVSQILEQPARYPSLIAWTGLLFLWVAGLGVPADHRTQHPVLAGLKTDRNDYLDAQIGAEAARAAMLLVEDKGLINRCELLRTRGCIAFRSMNLGEFLGKRTTEIELAHRPLGSAA